MSAKKTGIMLSAIIVLALLFYGCTGASSTPGAPTPAAATFAPAPAGETQKTRIAAFNEYFEPETYAGVLERLNKAVADAGQNVEFEVQYKHHQQGAATLFLDKVKAELAAGNPSADAYLFSFIDSAVLFNDGYTMELTDLVPSLAPVYYSRYKSIFQEKLTGVPVGIFSIPVISRTCLVLRQDFNGAGSSVDTTEEFFSFLDNTIANSKNKSTILAFPSIIATQWALEQGYYLLANYGMNGWVFAAINDPQCKPVLAESIPGCEDFLLQLMTHYYNGSLSIMSGQPGTEVAGMVRDLSEYYSPYAYIWLSPVAGEVTAHPFTPELPAMKGWPGYVNELSIPAVCAGEKVADAIKFVEWLYTDQQHYDVVLYGEKGVDYAETGGRYTPLSAGKEVRTSDYAELKSLYFAWPGAEMLYNYDCMRLPACAPTNAEQLAEDGLRQTAGYPINTLFEPDWKAKSSKLNALINGDIQAEVMKREESFAKLTQDAGTYHTKEMIAKGMEELGKCRNQWLLEQYAAIIEALGKDQ